MDDWQDKIKPGDIKVNVLGDVAGKTLIFTLPADAPIDVLEMFREGMIEAFPDAREVLVLKGDLIQKIDIIG